jgi:DNA-binding XRE family transcriptional regulator
LSLAAIGQQMDGITKQAVSLLLAAHGPVAVPPVVVRCAQCQGVITTGASLRRQCRPALCLDCLAPHPFAPFGTRLRAFRLAAGLTQAQLAARSGVSMRALYAYEGRGHGNPSWAVVVKLVRVLGHGLVWLEPQRKRAQ